ncbi:hypothetical protein SAMN05444487_109128 [Marininema mesophilum]|uniref:N-acetyltransferase domain-containing protein n=1 Tax=Marininema mesophilum TaxID=1048340 RepID=A0A1H2YNU2_9BACL|nr:GNAT family protein [Marininema mesophilum]SDX06304.1 hypothetical protein SAMN05444487_109128 [Marininema mesophilum]
MLVSIKGERVHLRDVTKEDLDTIWYWEYEAEDQEHHRWNGPYYAVEELSYTQFKRRWERNFLAQEKGETRWRLGIEIDGVLKGIVSRYWVDEGTDWLETGLVIYDSRYWSGGYGTEAFRLWIDYLFQHLATVRLGISTWSGNERMIRLAKRIGMIEEGRIRKARIVESKYYDSIKMGMLREEWMMVREEG